MAGTTTAAGGDAAIASAAAKIETENNAAFIPFTIGAAWLLDKGMTTYDTWQDVKAIRDGKKTLEQLAQEKGEEYVAVIIAGNLGKYGIKAGKYGGKWIAGHADDIVKAEKAAENKLLWGAWNSYPKVSKGNKTYAQIGDRLYTEHAVNRMQPSGLGVPVGEKVPGRNISPNLVDYVIRFGQPEHTVVEGVSRTVHWSGNVGVVTENSGKLVVTILRRSSE